MLDKRPPTGLVGIPQSLRLLATPTLPATEALESWSDWAWEPGDHLSPASGRKQGCIGVSNRQRGLKLDSSG